MQQVKIFKSIEPEVDKLQKDINDWIRAEKVHILSITGNISPQTLTAASKSMQMEKTAYAPSDVLVIVLYEKA